jgi:hypothetical protein
MTPLYIIERHEHGWLICSANGQGLPMDALQECLKLFPKGAVLAPGIAHHYTQTTGRHVVFAIATNQKAKCWEKEIEASITSLPPQERWWKGTDVGMSSASIFSTFADEPWRLDAHIMGCGAIPRDAEDFGRCKRLLGLFPEWRDRLGEVAVKYQGQWRAIIARWTEIENASPEKQNEILRSIP